MPMAVDMTVFYPSFSIRFLILMILVLLLSKVLFLKELWIYIFLVKIFIRRMVWIAGKKSYSKLGLAKVSRENRMVRLVLSQIYSVVWIRLKILESAMMSIVHVENVSILKLNCLKLSLLLDKFLMKIVSLPSRLISWHF